MTHLFWMHIKPPQKLKTLDFIDFPVAVSIKAVQHKNDVFLGMLTDKQKETFEKFDDCWDELTDINEREIFLYAFRLGMRIAI